MGRKKTSFEVDEQSLELAKKRLDHGELSEIVRRAIDRAADNEDAAKEHRLRSKLDDLRDEREEHKQQRDFHDRKVSDINRQIERTEKELQEYMNSESEYEGYLKSLLTQLREDGTHVFPEHKKVKEAGTIGGKTGEEVIQDLKERAEDIPDEQFERAY